MNINHAFSFACGGVMSEKQMQNYAQYVQVGVDNARSLGGWIAKQAETTLTKFNNFLDSRIWELADRLTYKNEGEYVGRFDIGYLSSLEAQQNAQGFMRDYIMANPKVMQLYLDGELSGYDTGFSSYCKGVKEENVYYRKAMNGVVHIEDNKAMHSHFTDSFSGDSLSFRERVNIQRTWLATQYHLASTLFDPTSMEGGKRKSHQDKEDKEPQPD